jgi:hypothetical protein
MSNPLYLTKKRLKTLGKPEGHLKSSRVVLFQSFTNFAYIPEEDHVPEEIQETVNKAFATLFPNLIPIVSRCSLVYRGDDSISLIDAGLGNTEFLPGKGVHSKPFYCNESNDLNSVFSIKRRPGDVTHHATTLYWLGPCYQIAPLTQEGTLWGKGFVYVATPEDYINMYGKYRPDILEKYPPFSDLMYISCNKCERWSPKGYEHGIILHCMVTKQYGLEHWLRAAPLATQVGSQGKVNIVKGPTVRYFDPLKAGRMKQLTMKIKQDKSK